MNATEILVTRSRALRGRVNQREDLDGLRSSRGVAMEEVEVQLASPSLDGMVEVEGYKCGRLVVVCWAGFHDQRLVLRVFD